MLMEVATHFVASNVFNNQFRVNNSPDHLLFAGGFLGAAFVAVNHVITKFRIKYLKRLKVAQVLEAIIVAMFSAAIAFAIMYLSGVCKPLGQDKNVRLQVSNCACINFI